VPDGLMIGWLTIQLQFIFGSRHRASGAALELSGGACSERLAGVFASRGALQHDVPNLSLKQIVPRRFHDEIGG